MTLQLAAAAACRFAGDACLMLLFGGCGLAAVGGPAAAQALNSSAVYRLRAWTVGCILLALLALFVVQAATVGEGWASAGDPSLLRILMLNTTFGQAWLWRLAAVTVLALAMVCGARAGVVASLSGIALALTAFSGHAAMHDGWLGVLHRGSQALHVLCAGAWVGGLMPLGCLLRQLENPALRASATHALRRFSMLGHFAVAGVLLTGVGNTLLILGGWPLHWTVPYQLLLSVKILLATGMVLLAVVNRYLWVPRLATQAPLAVRAIRRGTCIEIAVAAGVLALVAVFGLLEPR